MGAPDPPVWPSRAGAAVLSQPRAPVGPTPQSESSRCSLLPQTPTSTSSAGDRAFHPRGSAHSVYKAGLPAMPCGSLSEARPLDWEIPPVGGRACPFALLRFHFLVLQGEHQRRLPPCLPASLGWYKAGDLGALGEGLCPAPPRGLEIVITKTNGPIPSAQRVADTFRCHAAPGNSPPSSWSPQSRKQSTLHPSPKLGAVLSLCLALRFVVSCDGF